MGGANRNPKKIQVETFIVAGFRKNDHGGGGANRNPKKILSRGGGVQFEILKKYAPPNLKVWIRHCSLLY